MTNLTGPQLAKIKFKLVENSPGDVVFSWEEVGDLLDTLREVEHQNRMLETKVTARDSLLDAYIQDAIQRLGACRVVRCRLYLDHPGACRISNIV